MNDLISRSALLEAWRKIRGVCVPELVVDCMIGEAPAVDAEPVRHGRWGKFEKTKHKTVCSECKCPVPFKKQAKGYHLAWKSNFCPNCGAKMEEKDN